MTSAMYQNVFDMKPADFSKSSTEPDKTTKRFDFSVGLSLSHIRTTVRSLETLPHNGYGTLAHISQDNVVYHADLW